MARVRRKIMFCIECGKQNPQRNKKCQYCKKQLHQKNHLFRDYLYKNIKDNLKERVADNIFSILKNYILSNLYGTILVATVVFTASSIILNAVISNAEINEIETRPVIVASRLNICDNSIEPKFYCDDSLGFNENNMCVKVKTADAESEKVCPSGYHLNGSRCVSDKTYTKITEEVCQMPDSLPEGVTSWEQVIRVYEFNDECLLESCLADGFDENGVCQAGGSQAIDYTTATKCEEGALINGECRTFRSFTTEYSCEEGTLDGKKCKIEYEEEPRIECDDGYQYNEECKACVEVE